MVASYHPKLWSRAKHRGAQRVCLKHCVPRGPFVRGVRGAEQSYNGCLLLQTATRRGRA